MLFLGKALGVSLEHGGVFDDQAARRETSERLRRDVWMFAQIVRAFSSKAQHSQGEDGWAPLHGFQYVREFLAYFRAMGYPLLRAADYPRFDLFMAAMTRLEDTDLVDPARLEDAIDECVAFHGFLTRLFDDISKRDELAGVAVRSTGSRGGAQALSRRLSAARELVELAVGIARASQGDPSTRTRTRLAARHGVPDVVICSARPVSRELG